MYPIPEVFPETAWRGAFARWRAIVEPITDTPLPYHFANLLAVLAAQLGDLAVLDEGVDTFLNFFIFSYGRTGTRKTTAMKLVNQHLVKKFDTKHFTALPSINSAEGLMRVLATKPHNVLLHYDEVKHLFAVANRSGSGIESVINESFDLSDLGTCVRAASESLAGVPYFFTMIVNGTPVHINTDVNESLFHGGLINRFLVFACKPSMRHLPRMLTPDRDVVEDFVARLNVHIEAWRNFAGTDADERMNRGAVRIGISDEAMEVFEPWDRQHDTSTKTESELSSDPVQRIPLYAKKIAAMFCIWEQPNPEAAPMISAEQMRAALDVAEYCKASILHMSSGWQIRSAAARGDALAETRVEEYLKKRGCADERTIYRELKMSVGEMKKAVTSLAGMNIVQPGMDRMVHYQETCQCNTVVRLAAPPAAEPTTAPPFEETPMYAPEDE